MRTQAKVEPMQPHLVSEAYTSLLRKAAEWDEEDWESSQRFERHAINAALDIRELKLDIRELKQLNTELLEALKGLWPHCHENSMKGESGFEKAWLKAEAAIKKATGE